MLHIAHWYSILKEPVPWDFRDFFTPLLMFVIPTFCYSFMSKQVHLQGKNLWLKNQPALYSTIRSISTKKAGQLMALLIYRTIGLFLLQNTLSLYYYYNSRLQYAVADRHIPVWSPSLWESLVARRAAKSDCKMAQRSTLSIWRDSSCVCPASLSVPAPVHTCHMEFRLLKGQCHHNRLEILISRPPRGRQKGSVKKNWVDKDYRHMYSRETNDLYIVFR